MTEDPFPRERVTLMARRMPAYLRLAWRLAKDPLLSKARRAAVIGAAGYLASPVDLVPGVIPVLGQLDDIAVAIAALKIALSGLDPERRRVHLESVGLGDDDLAADLRTLGATTAWIGRAGYRSSRRAVAASGRVVTERAAPAARAVGSKAAPAARAAMDRTAPARRVVTDKAGPALQATGRAAKGAGWKAADVAGAAIRRFPGRGPSKVTVRRVELPMLPPPPPARSDD
ncbi:MAG TPA: YkvA family protein [Candidatus Limnocylindrales bacterium]|nr:YkvA family protein [Candidatus Limnocylindrales bacterium]